VAAVIAPFSQAIGSFLLHLLAQHFLGVEGLGRFALVYGLLVIATSISTGLVGDSLTVLDRHDPRVRSGLQRVMWMVSIASGTLVFAGGLLTSRMSTLEATLAGFVCCVFVIEDALRRNLMATLQFWSLALVDVTALVVSVCFVLVVAWFGAVSQAVLLLALLISQTVATGLAIRLLPEPERRLVRRIHPDVGVVWRFGSLRSLSQMMRPTMMASVRFIVVGFLGITAFGELEAARLFVAPAMLMVGGVSAYLFASYARDRTRPLDELRRRADRAVVVLAVLTLTAGVGATVVGALVGDRLVGDGATLRASAVLGWAMYAAASAAVTPYGSLAAVRGGQLHVVQLRAAESAVSVAAVVLALALGAAAPSVPFVLAAAAVASGITMRHLVERLIDTSPAAAAAPIA
jgi:O-antigen/teichoic acid export membrane protein